MWGLVSVKNPIMLQLITKPPYYKFFVNIESRNLRLSLQGFVNIEKQNLRFIRFCEYRITKPRVYRVL